MADAQEQVYVLRLWTESTPPDGGYISLYHVGSGLRLYFGSLGALLEYLQAHLGRDPRTPHEPPRRSQEEA
ncbi:hypothetical protein [Deinococcus aluminii]|uniref:Uncharacterized protein n=1 Tax=Deinococcus aluminii TaxID=1656885 RepID=A0ABP9XGX2_9DEIO